MNRFSPHHVLLGNAYTVQGKQILVWSTEQNVAGCSPLDHICSLLFFVSCSSLTDKVYKHWQQGVAYIFIICNS